VVEAEGLDNLPPEAGACDLIVAEEQASGGPLPCRVLRAAGLTQPLLLLAARPEGPEGHGADAIACRPVRLAQLAAQIDRLLAQPPAGPPIGLGPWRFDRGRRLLEGADGAVVRLTDKEAAILARLARAGGGTVSRDTLLDEVWGYGEGIDTHTLETHVYRLRRKLDTGAPGLLLTEPGGYRLAVAPTAPLPQSEP